MARKRMIDPCIWASEDFAELSLLAKIVWIGLFSHADDEGRGRARASYIKSTLFPYDENEITVKKIDNALNEIAKTMSVDFYEIGESEYYQLTHWKNFQSIEKAQMSKLPAFTDASTRIRVAVGEQSGSDTRPIVPNRIEVKRIEEKGINISPNGDVDPDALGEPLPAEIKKASPTITLEKITEYFTKIYGLHLRHLGKEQALKTFVKKLHGLDPEAARVKANEIYAKLSRRISTDWQPRIDEDEANIKFVPYLSSWLNSEIADAPKRKK